MLNLPPLDLTRDVLARHAKTAQEAGDTANANALNKADLQAPRIYGEIGIAFDGALLIPSRTSADAVYRVSELGCSCKAGQEGRPCWHASLAECIHVAYEEYVAVADEAADLTVAVTPAAAALIAEIAALPFDPADDAAYARIVVEAENARIAFAAKARAEREVSELYP